MSQMEVGCPRGLVQPTQTQVGRTPYKPQCPTCNPAMSPTRNPAPALAAVTLRLEAQWKKIIAQTLTLTQTPKDNKKLTLPGGKGGREKPNKNVINQRCQKR